MQFLSRLLLFCILYSEKAFHSQKLIQAIPVGSIKELNLPTNFILSYAVDFSTYSLLLEYWTGGFKVLQGICKIHDDERHVSSQNLAAGFKFQT